MAAATVQFPHNATLDAVGCVEAITTQTRTVTTDKAISLRRQKCARSVKEVPAMELAHASVFRFRRVAADGIECGSDVRQLTPLLRGKLSPATQARMSAAVAEGLMMTAIAAATIAATLPHVEATASNATSKLYGGGESVATATTFRSQMNVSDFVDYNVSVAPPSAPSSVSATATDAAPLSVDAYFSGMAWPQALIVAIFLLLILVTIVGNTLVILSVLTTRRLRTVTNCFVMNLAITDWLVGTCVMPPAVIIYIVGSWRFGWILCDIWISLDVLLCTGSILSLCAISLDRYLAVMQPLTYSKKRRSKRLALFMIFVVWVTALSITCPPYLGWYEPGRRQKSSVDCRYNQNKGYVVFSAMGSFFIPLAVMLYVYLKIGYVLTSRRQRIVRDANSERTADHDIDCDNFLSESEHIQCATPKFTSFKSRWGVGGSGSTSSSKTNSLKCDKCNKNFIDQGGLKHQASFYELVEISRLSSLIHCSAMSCKYGGPACMHAATMGVGVTLNGDKRAASLPLQTLHYTESSASFTETCLARATTTTTTTTMAATVTSTSPQAVAYLKGHPHHQRQAQQQHQSHNHASLQHHHHHHHHHHHGQPQVHAHHRVPMRVSTTKRDKNTAKTLTMVMGGFIACWLPFFIYYLLIPFLPPAAVFEELMSFLTWVGWVNCAINPFIYAFYNPDFRTAFWRLTCRRICKQKPPPNHMAMFRG